MNERQLNHIEGEISSVREKVEPLEGQVEYLTGAVTALGKRVKQIEYAENTLKWIVFAAIFLGILGLFFR